MISALATLLLAMSQADPRPEWTHVVDDADGRIHVRMGDMATDQNGAVFRRAWVRIDLHEPIPVENGFVARSVMGSMLVNCESREAGVATVYFSQPMARGQAVVEDRDHWDYLDVDGDDSVAALHASICIRPPATVYSLPPTGAAPISF